MLVPRGATAARVGSVTLGKGQGKGRDKGRGKGGDRQERQVERDQKGGPGTANGKSETKDKKTEKQAAAKKLLGLLLGADDDDTEDEDKPKETSKQQADKTEVQQNDGGGKKTDAEGDGGEETAYNTWVKNQAKQAPEPASNSRRDGGWERFSAKDTLAGKPKWFFPEKAVQGEAADGSLVLLPRAETYARIESDWAGIYLRDLPEDWLLESMKSIHEHAACRIISVAVSQEEVDTMQGGGGAPLSSMETQNA